MNNTMTSPPPIQGAAVQAVPRNKVLSNTYMLLSATLVFSGSVALATMQLGLPAPGLILTLVGYFGLFFLTYKMRNSVAGLGCVFALTGFMGYTLGPVLGAYWSMAPNVVMQALFMTGFITFSLSMYAIKSKRDFRFLGSFLFVGVITAFLIGLAAVIFNMPGVQLAVSGLFVLLMSGMILYETSEIVNGGETNYIMATVSLYVSIYNLFMSLLHILGFLQQE